MNLPPEFIPVKARVRRKRHTGSPAAAPPAALTLVSVAELTVIGPEIEMNLVFDVSGTDSLNDVAGADPAKWTARYQGQTYVGSIMTNAAPDSLYLQMTPAGAEAGPDVLGYANAPSDISDSLGRFLAAFAGFPL